MHSSVFEKYKAALESQHVSAVWRGHGSALFLEIGKLSPRSRRDGSAGYPQGEQTIMIEWSWRIEDANSILCGSWSEEQKWAGILQSLIGRRIESISLYSRLPELSITLSGGMHVASFMTAEGQPAWTIFQQHNPDGESSFISVEEGRIVEGRG